MRVEFLDILRCPKTGRKLKLHDAEIADGKIKYGILLEETSDSKYKVIDYIPRFVPQENYSSSFGFQWNLHSNTQYDEHSGFNESEKRFRDETSWPIVLKDQYILEVGGGSGRFTEHAIKSGGIVVSLDYSSAVEANYRANGHNDNVLILQASVYEMPFEREYFDRAFCFGVLQHTPNPRKAFESIVEYVKPGGSIATDIYVKDLTHWLLHTKYWVRPLTKRLGPERLYRWVKKYIDTIWPIAKVIRKIPKIGCSINWHLLIADHSRTLPNASDQVLKKWAYLDTFDMLSPAFDQPETLNNYKKWHTDAGLESIEVKYGYNGIEGRAFKPVHHSTE